MECFNLNGSKYDQQELAKIAVQLNNIGTRLSNLSSSECIQFMTKIPCSKPESDFYDNKIDDVPQKHLTIFNKNDLAAKEEYSSHSSREPSFTNHHENQNNFISHFSLGGWKFYNKCSALIRRPRYTLAIFNNNRSSLSSRGTKSRLRSTNYVGVSYGKFIKPSLFKSEHKSNLNLDEFIRTITLSANPQLTEYDDKILYLKNLILNKHSDSAFYNEQKNILNKCYSEGFKQFSSALTFTKLFNLRNNLFNMIDLVPELDPAIIAAGWTFFERLVMENYVTPSNRKIFAAVCLIISFKFYQDDTFNTLSSLTNALQTLDSYINITNRKIFSLEIHIFTLLRFNLTLNYPQVFNHLNYYLSLNNTTFEEFYSQY